MNIKELITQLHGLEGLQEYEIELCMSDNINDDLIMDYLNGISIDERKKKIIFTGPGV